MTDAIIDWGIGAKSKDEHREEQRVITTAFISALVNGVRQLPQGVEVGELYSSVAKVIDRESFAMILDELVKTKVFRRRGLYVYYSGPTESKA